MGPQKPTGPKISSGRGTAPGKSYDPSGTQTPEDQTDDKKLVEVPIGIPITKEEFDRLKNKAKKPKICPPVESEQDSTQSRN